MEPFGYGVVLFGIKVVSAYPNNHHDPIKCHEGFFGVKNKHHDPNKLITKDFLRKKQ